MAKILVACASGAGTSLMMKMTVQKTTNELGMPVENIHHCALFEGVNTASQFDIVFVPINFVDMYKDAKAAGVIVIGLYNILSEKEVKEKLIESGAVEKFKG